MGMDRMLNWREVAVFNIDNTATPFDALALAHAAKRQIQRSRLKTGDLKT